MGTQGRLFSDAQRDMRNAYYGGALGVLTSATVWAVAGSVASFYSPAQAILALFIGGMAIHPVSVLLCKLLGRSGSHAKDNPLGALALSSTFWMLLLLPLAYAVSRYRIEWFFPAMLFVIGGRYLTFHTLYGLRQYLVCGGMLAAAGWGLVSTGASPALGAFSGAVIEAVFGVVLLLGQRTDAESKSVSQQSV